MISKSVHGTFERLDSYLTLVDDVFRNIFDGAFGDALAPVLDWGWDG